MKNGDISNQTLPRIIVVIDTVIDSEFVETKKAFRTTSERVVKRLNNAVLSGLWNMGMKFNVSFELAAYENEGWTEKHLDSFMARLENRGANPFNHAELYPDIENFIDELPYRANFKGVVDIPERVARYGSWGIEFNNL